MMTCADFGQPIIDLPKVAGGFDADRLADGDYRPTLDTPKGAGAAEYLMELLQYSPPDILSMSWYERVRPYAAGKVAMAYGYTLLAPYFELDESCPAMATPAICRIRTARKGAPIAPVGGYALVFRPTSAGAHRRRGGRGAHRLHLTGSAEALCPERQPHQRRAIPSAPIRRCAACRRSSNGRPDVLARRAAVLATPADPANLRHHPDLRRGMHDMLRGIVSPRDALSPPGRAEEMLENQSTREEDMDPNRLKGKNILITGAARGMGAANAEAFAAQGANVCLGDLDVDARRRSRTASTQPANGKAIAVKMDVTKREDNAAPSPPRSTRSARSMWALQRRPQQAPVLHGYR
jgi:hypothetical protein